VLGWIWRREGFLFFLFLGGYPPPEPAPKSDMSDTGTHTTRTLPASGRPDPNARPSACLARDDRRSSSSPRRPLVVSV